ncbi:DUF603 domain-containing protein [Borrelia duttonii]|uniref:Family 115-like protein n=1 Tax=Borrelia duttonii (strain Ly) TaxID=412419 RepID=B5RP64_BORDL|nr:family 115-like protein [Borrelia duttonii Ly]ACH94241.1 family 115-like protein [Borrelia duttonii Ly]
MNKVKKSFDDYIVYFNGGKLSDAQISKEMGVNRANVCKMRRRWESRESNNLEEHPKVTISEETLNNVLICASEHNAQSGSIRSQLHMSRNRLGLEFIASFNSYLDLEFKSYNNEIKVLESKIERLKGGINNEDDQDLNNKLCELDEVKRAKELKKMELYYQAMLKLKATDFESQVKFKI